MSNLSFTSSLTRIAPAAAETSVISKSPCRTENSPDARIELPLIPARAETGKGRVTPCNVNSPFKATQSRSPLPLAETFEHSYTISGSDRSPGLPRTSCDGSLVGLSRSHHRFQRLSLNGQRQARMLDRRRSLRETQLARKISQLIVSLTCESALQAILGNVDGKD